MSKKEEAPKEQKPKDFESACAKLDKDYGKGSIIHGGELESYSDVISTGSLGLDHALGIGGLPFGKIIDIYGWESSGKSTLVQTLIGNAQKKFQGTNKKCIYVDGENSLDGKYAKALGVDLDSLIVIQLDESGGEGAYNKAEVLIETGEVGLVVFDSQNSLQPKSSMIDGDIGDAAMGKHARMLGQVLPKYNSLCIRFDTMIVFVEQLREKIGVMFGSPITTQGGNAIKFYSQIRLDVSKQVLGEEEDKYNKTKVKVAKNKLAPPFGVATFDIIYGKGIEKVGELVDIAVDLGIIKKSGSWFSYEGSNIGQGADKVVALLEDNLELYQEIYDKVKVGLNEGG